LEPSCSGVVIYLGCRKRFPQLLHHNFYFSGDANAEFEDLYERKLPHADPTIYLAVPSRTDPSVAPEGCENIYILVHTPYITAEYDWSSNAAGYRDLILDKLERSGLEGLRESIETERMLTPLDIESLYRVNRGSIYGVVTQRGLHSAFKTGNRSRNIKGLYFCGGSVNPGPGVPMALMSGQIAADCVMEDVPILEIGTTAHKTSLLKTGLLFGGAAAAAWGAGTLAIRLMNRLKRAPGEPPAAS
ncbi:MAG: hypothetical protein M3Y56_02545, partial [Armatimonadota bacterium]|nr:hypothetical protein [Armatimonadota bacterium]